MAKRKPGKYHAVVQNLPEAGFFDGDFNNPKSQELINTRMSEIINGIPEEGIAPEPRHASHLLTMVLACRDAKDEAKAKLKAINIDLEAYTRLMAAQYEAEGIYTMELEDVGGIRLQEEVYTSTEDALKVQEWALADPDLRKKVTLPYPSLNAVVKALLLKGIDVPPGVKAFKKLKAVRIGAKAEGGEEE